MPQPTPDAPQIAPAPSPELRPGVHKTLQSAACRGLAEAMANAPMALVCARGHALQAALAAQPAFAEAAQWPLLALTPRAQQAWGAGIYRLGKLMMVWGPQRGDSDAGIHNALRAARAHHCPTVALHCGPAGDALGGPQACTWQLPVGTAQDARSGGFATSYLSFVAVALLAAELRTPRFGPRRASCAAPADGPEAAWHAALAAAPTALQAMQAHAMGSNDVLRARIVRACRQALRVQVHAEEEMLPAVRAWASTVRGEWPPVVLAADAEHDAAAVGVMHAPGVAQLRLSAAHGHIAVTVQEPFAEPPCEPMQLPVGAQLLAPLWAYGALECLSGQPSVSAGSD